MISIIHSNSSPNRFGHKTRVSEISFSFFLCVLKKQKKRKKFFFAGSEKSVSQDQRQCFAGSEIFSGRIEDEERRERMRKEKKILKKIYRFFARGKKDKKQLKNHSLSPLDMWPELWGTSVSRLCGKSRFNQMFVSPHLLISFFLFFFPQNLGINCPIRASTTHSFYKVIF